MKTRYALVLCLLAPLMLATGCDDDVDGGGGGNGDGDANGQAEASFADVFDADANAEPTDFDAGGIDFGDFGGPNDDASDDNDFLN